MSAELLNQDHNQQFSGVQNLVPLYASPRTYYMDISGQARAVQGDEYLRVTVGSNNHGSIYNGPVSNVTHNNGPVHNTTNHYTTEASIDPVQARMKALSESLFFPEMFKRRDDIDQEHEGTCSWVESRSSPYTRWLESRDSVFWVSGNLGTGKSVLMKYLYNNYLESMDSGSCVVIAYWFSEIGSAMQRTLEGCLRSFLWQCINSNFGLEIFHEYETDLGHSNPWDVRRLTKLIMSCLSFLNLRKIHVRIYIDGIDESGSHARKIIDFVRELATRHMHIKICLSSRPEQTFKKAFESCSSLVMQDRNKQDIDMVINDELFRERAVAESLQGRDNERERLHAILRHKAQGVFLWVRLAIESVIRGFNNNDEPHVLEQRLEDLPENLDTLYSAMLTRNGNDVNNRYRETASLYLNVVLNHTGANSDYCFLQDFCLLSDSSYRTLLLDDHNWSAETVLKRTRLKEAKDWINVKSGGLLEVKEHIGLSDPLSTRLRMDLKDIQSLRRHKVQFIHRSVRKYLSTTVQGKRLISQPKEYDQQFDDARIEAWLIDRFILPGIDKGYLDVSLREDFFNCGPKNVKPSTKVLQQAENIWLNAARRKWLVLVDSLLVSADLNLHLLRLPCLPNGKPDMLRIYCYLGWFDLVAKVLHETSERMDPDRLSILVMDAVIRDWHIFLNPYCDDTIQLVGPQSVNKTYSAFFDHLKQLGLDHLSRPIHTIYGENTTAISEIMLRDLSSDYRSMSRTVNCELASFKTDEGGIHVMTKIESIDKILSRTDTSSSFFLLGKYGFRDLLAMTNICNEADLRASLASLSQEHTGVVDTTRSMEESRISVMVHRIDRKTDGHSHEENYPLLHLYAITDTDSAALISKLKEIKSNGASALSQMKVSETGAVYLSGSADQECLEYSLMRTICERSEIIPSWFQAMHRVGRTSKEFAAFADKREEFIKSADLRVLQYKHADGSAEMLEHAQADIDMELLKLRVVFDKASPDDVEKYKSLGLPIIAHSSVDESDRIRRD